MINERLLDRVQRLAGGQAVSRPDLGTVMRDRQPLPSRGHERPKPAGVDRRRTGSGARLSRCAAGGGRRMTAAPPQEVLDPAVAALHRAMPYTRLVDCGMNPADARVLLAATTAGQAWAEVAGELARDRSAAVQSALAAGHRLTAAQSARWAAGAALFAQMADNEDTPRKRRLYRRYVDLVSQVADLSEPALERGELPYRDGRLVGWLGLPPSGRAAATVVLWGGLSAVRPTFAPPMRSPPAGWPACSPRDRARANRG